MKQAHFQFSTTFILMSAVLLGSCSDRSGRDKSTDIRFDSIVVEQKIPLIQTSDTTLPYAEVNVAFTYPIKFRDAASLARLQQIFQGTFFGDLKYDHVPPEEAIKRYIDDYTRRYQSLSNSFYEAKSRLGDEIPAWYWYYMNTSNKILFRDDSLVSYAVEYSDYEGGAHGSYRITYTNIDLNRLVTLSEEDLFVPDYYKTLTKKIVDHLMQSYGVNEPDSLLNMGFFTIEDIVPNNNFWLNDEGIHYTYNQYEIAPYYMGAIDVMIPYTDLQDILLPKVIVSRYLTAEK